MSHCDLLSKISLILLQTVISWVLVDHFDQKSMLCTANFRSNMAYYFIVDTAFEHFRIIGSTEIIMR